MLQPLCQWHNLLCPSVSASAISHRYILLYHFPTCNNRHTIILEIKNHVMLHTERKNKHISIYLYLCECVYSHISLSYIIYLYKCMYYFILQPLCQWHNHLYPSVSASAMLHRYIDAINSLITCLEVILFLRLT